MPTLKIDGREVTVEPGTTILTAAGKAGIEVPTFCFHPGLSIAGNCRMCLVETSMNGRKGPKPVPACHAQVADGMEVETNTERIVKTRKAVLEFILLNHPIDCPTCDKAGECVLQDHYVKYSAQPSRLFHRKQHKAKAKILGPTIILDAERCILCSRCVRFCDEVAQESQLEIVNRGEHSEITTFPGMQLDNPYAGNVVDICPVGALTSRDFRFKTRVWFLQSERSVCPECSRGCSVRVDSFENTVRRLKPVYNSKVNTWWMCDDGRYAYKDYLDGRMEGPTVSDGGGRKAVRLETALEAAAARLSGGGRGLAVVVTPWFTNEDAYLVAKLLHGPLAGAAIYVGGRAPGVEDAILRRADKNPNRRGLEAIFAAFGLVTLPLAQFSASGLSRLLLFGDQHAVNDQVRGALASVPERIVVTSFKSPWWDLATVFLPARIHWEKDGSFTNFEGRVQRIRRAVKAAVTVKSEGWYAMKLAQALGVSGEFESVGAIFAALGREVPAFAGLTFEALGDEGLVLGSGAAPALEDKTTAEAVVE